MTLTPVQSLPKRSQYSKNDLEKLVKEFVDSGIQIARIDYYASECKSENTLYAGIKHAVTRLDAKVKVQMRNRQVYLVKL